MNIFFNRIVCTIALAIVSLSFAPMPVSAGTPWGVALDSSGNVSGCVGTLCENGGGGSGGLNISSNPYGLPEGSILGIARNFLFWLLAIFAILGVVGFVISGIFYLVSAGDEGMADKGKDGMKWSIIGIIVGLSGFIIMQAVNMLLDGSSKTF